jgi:hypothetical protein
MTSELLDCTAVSRDDLVARYLTDDVTDTERQAFEVHYFDCPACLEALETLRAAQVAMRERGAIVTRERRIPTWASLAAAATLLAALSGFLLFNRDAATPVEPAATTAGPQPSAGIAAPVPTGPASTPPASVRTADTLQRLARFEPMPAAPPLLRGPLGANAFNRAMTHYREGRYEAARGLLRELATSSPTVETSFFLGVIEARLDSPTVAITHLERVTSAGDTPYLEDGWFYLAKASLLAGDARGAASALERAVALGGERLGEAESLLKELRSLNRQP